MKRAIILNGAPGVGKDTIGCILADHYEQVEIVSFKEPMFNIARAILGDANFDYFMFLYNDRLHKEKPDNILNGKSPREFLIWISEEVIKPQFGNDYFGKMAAIKIKQSSGVVVVTDGGFSDEIIALINQGIEVKICRLHRDGFTFEGDSRSHIQLPSDWYGVNGYEEKDFQCIDGLPGVAAKQIADEFLKGAW